MHIYCYHTDIYLCLFAFEIRENYFYIQGLHLLLKSLSNSLAANSPAFYGRLTHFEEEFQIENVSL